MYSWGVCEGVQDEGDEVEPPARERRIVANSRSVEDEMELGEVADELSGMVSTDANSGAV